MLKRKDIQKKLFNDVNRVMDWDALLSYLYFNKWFDINTDAIYHQLGAVIIQDGKPISFYIHKWTKKNDAQ